MKRICSIVFFVIPIICSSQNKNSIWCFGDSAGIDFYTPNNPQVFSSGMNGRGGCGSMADSNGNLRFYAYSYVSLLSSCMRALQIHTHYSSLRVFQIRGPNLFSIELFAKLSKAIMIVQQKQDR